MPRGLGVLPSVNRLVQPLLARPDIYGVVVRDVAMRGMVVLGVAVGGADMTVIGAGQVLVSTRSDVIRTRPGAARRVPVQMQRMLETRQRRQQSGQTEGGGSFREASTHARTQRAT